MILCYILHWNVLEVFKGVSRKEQHHLRTITLTSFHIYGLDAISSSRCCPSAQLTATSITVGIHSLNGLPTLRMKCDTNGCLETG